MSSSVGRIIHSNNPTISGISGSKLMFQTTRLPPLEAPQSPTLPAAAQRGSPKAASKVETTSTPGSGNRGKKRDLGGLQNHGEHMEIHGELIWEYMGIFENVKECMEKIWE